MTAWERGEKGSGKYAVYSAFDLAGLRAKTAKPTALYLMCDVDMNGQGKDGIYNVPSLFTKSKKTSKKTTTKKATTKTVAKTENLKKFLIRFKSYSFDNFYMLTTNNKLVDQKTGKLKITAKEFCKTYVPEEYEGWKRRKFEYELFEVWPVGDDGIAEVVNRIGGPFIFTETDRIDTNEMPEDVALFSDSIDFV